MLSSSSCGLKDKIKNRSRVEDGEDKIRKNVMVEQMEKKVGISDSVEIENNGRIVKSMTVTKRRLKIMHDDAQHRWF